MTKFVIEGDIALCVGAFAGVSGALLGAVLGFDPLYVGACGLSAGILLVFARPSRDGLCMWSLALGVPSVSLAFVPQLPVALEWVATVALGIAIASAIAASVDFVRTHVWH